MVKLFTRFRIRSKLENRDPHLNYNCPEHGRSLCLPGLVRSIRLSRLMRGVIRLPRWCRGLRLDPRWEASEPCRCRPRCKPQPGSWIKKNQSISKKTLKDFPPNLNIFYASACQKPGCQSNPRLNLWPSRWRRPTVHRLKRHLQSSLSPFFWSSRLGDSSRPLTSFSRLTHFLWNC